MKIKRLVSFLLVLSMSFLPISAEEFNQYDQDQSLREAKINNLLDDRAGLLNKLNLSEMDYDYYEKRMQDINSELMNLGVDFLSFDQVCEQFPESKSNKELAFSGVVHNDLTRTSPPSSDINTWMSYRTTLTVGNTSYDIQKLVAQGKSFDSPLLSSGSAIKYFNSNWVSGLTNVFKESATALVGSIQEVAGFVTFYELLSSFVSGVSTSTVITAPHIVYSWSNATTAVFTYVRKSFQSDYYQFLTQVSTKTQTTISYQSPGFSYQNPGSAWVPQVVQGSCTKFNTPIGYDNNYVAISVYNTMTIADQRHVWYIYLEGPENTPIHTIYALCPSVPYDCE